MIASDTRIVSDQGIRTLAQTLPTSGTIDPQVIVTEDKASTLLEVITTHGYRIRCTKDTLLTGFDKNIKVKNLQPGDGIRIQSDNFLYSNYGNYEEGVAIGLLTRSAISQKDRYAFITIPSQYEISANRAQDLVASLTSPLRTMELYIRGNEDRLHGGSQLFDWLADKESDPETIMHCVPNYVFRGSMELMKGYLSSLAFCGWDILTASLDESGYVIVFGSLKNRLLATQVQLLLLNFGIVTKLSASETAIMMNMKNFSNFLATISIWGESSKQIDRILALYDPFFKIPEAFITTVKSVKPYEKTACVKISSKESLILNGFVIPAQ